MKTINDILLAQGLQLGAFALPADQVTIRSVSTGGTLPVIINTTQKKAMSRSRHEARDGISCLSLVYTNWFCDNSAGEVGLGGVLKVSASIEYPIGVFTVVEFGGNNSISIDSLGTSVSDLIPVVIPDRAIFFIRTFTESSVGILYGGKSSEPLGEGFEYGVTVTNKCFSGTVGRSGADGDYRPAAIVANSNKPAVLLIGTSRTFGVLDTIGSYNTFRGELSRAISPYFASSNYGVSGDRVAVVVANMSGRAALSRYFTTAIIELGINDFIPGLNDTQILTFLNSIASQLSCGYKIACTLTPYSTSTDSFSTTVNQTPSAYEGYRIGLNNKLRQSDAFSAIFDLADAVESARDSGKWKAPGYTADGLHGNPLSNNVISSSGVVKMGAIK
jgi:hypothetical protein